MNSYISELKSIARISLIFTAFLFAVSCGPTDQSETVNDHGATLDLIKLYPVARQLSETQVVRMTSPLSDFFFREGWSFTFSESDEEKKMIAAVATEATLNVHVLRPVDRWLLFDAKTVGTFGGPASQELTIRCGDLELANLRINGNEFQRYQVFIPAAAQRIGDNSLIFELRDFAENPHFLSAEREEHEEFPYPGVAGYFNQLRITGGDSSGPAKHSLMKPDDIFALVANESRLAQYANSSLVYAFDIVEGSLLRIAGNVEAQDAEQTPIAVSVTSRTDEETKPKVLWKDELQAGEGSSPAAFAAEISLDELAGRCAELSFNVSAESSAGNRALIWKQMELFIPTDSDTGSGPDSLKKQSLSSGIRNVIFIIIDAARADHLGVMGNSEGITPNMDAFARKSILFRNAVISAPYTIASISTLFSGLNPESHGVRGVTDKFPSDLVNLPQAFKQKGFYTIALTGSKFLTRKFGLSAGCEDVIYLRREKDMVVQATTMDESLMERGIKKAAQSGKPVFLYAHFLPPHWPYNPPAPFNTRFVADPEIALDRSWKVQALFDNKLINADNPDVKSYHLKYKNSYAYADYLIGKMLDLLAEYELSEDSLIVVTADHGESFGEHGTWSHNTAVYDTMIRVPLIVKMPGQGPREIDQQVGLIDFFPTLAELFDLETDGVVFEGRSIAPLLLGQEQQPADYYYARATGNKLIFTMRGKRFKYIHNNFVEELYDLEADPGETLNIISRHPVLATYLRQRALLAVTSAGGLKGRRGEKAELTEKDREELRNLGYLN